MKKIGLITFHRSNNCGSMLQAFALQQKLKDLGYDPTIIDFSSKGQRELYSIMPSFFLNGKFKKSQVKLWFLCIPYKKLLKKESLDYNYFIDKYFILTKRKYLNNKSLCEETFKFDAYITGSDQVWNINCVDADDAYFLNFVKEGRKIAYATSLGANDIKKTSSNPDKYVNFLKTFNYISVREKNAVSQITTLSNRNDIQMHIDPTLFMTQKEWTDSIEIGNRLVKGEYIFYYAFNYSKEVNNTVLKISQKYNLPVYIIDVKNWGARGLKNIGFKLSPKFGPAAFINLIKYAKLVLTTSFHGTVFSVIFNKPFWYIESSMHNIKDDRAVSLLSQLELPSRLQNSKYLLTHDAMETWDFDKVQNRITELQNQAYTFLKQSIDK